MKYLERFLLVLAAVMLAGANKCREDYFFATQARVSISPTASGSVTATPSGSRTATPTATETDDGGDDDGNPDDDGTPTVTPTVTSTATITGTANSTRTSVSAAFAVRSNSKSADSSDIGLLSALEVLDDPLLPTPTAIPSAQLNAFGNSLDLGENWLGNMHRESDTDSPNWNLDSDKDGIVDGLESSLGTDPYSSASFPQNLPRTSLGNRLKTDPDYDGLNNQQEQQQGTRPEVKDSDSDGIADGLEYLSGSNPLNAGSLPVDTDLDGLSDDYEISQGINASLKDTDGDALSDGLELEIGSNPLVKDTDLDGILDGKEYQLGGDPLISDFPNQ